MARTMTTALKAVLDSELGSGGAAKVIAAINSTHTAFDANFRHFLSCFLGGIGEAIAFETACTSNTASATLQGRAWLMNRLEHRLRGRGNAEELVLCIADGTIT